MRSSPGSRTSSRPGTPDGGGTGTVFNIQRFSIDDGPGIRTTVFMKGCPMRCTWCHNPEGLEHGPQLMWFDVRCIGARDCLAACPKGALELTGSGMVIDRELCDACGACAEACPAGALEVVGNESTPGEVFDEVARDEAFYRNSSGGMTLSGGEPAMQPGFSWELLKLCSGAGFHTALDTCGYASPDVLEGLVDLADMVLLDLKIIDPHMHMELTGVDLEQVLRNARMISGKGKPLWIRTPVIPGCTDSTDNIAGLSSFICGLPAVERYDLLAFNNTCGAKYRRLDMEWKLDGTPLVTGDKMEQLASIARDAGVPNVRWSGATRER